MSTLLHMLQGAATSNARLRLVDIREREQEIPYRKVYDRALAAASDLERAGVRSGDHVALVLPTGIGFFDAFFGAMALGAVPVPLYPPVRLGRLDEYHARTASMLRACEAVLVVTERRIDRVLGRTLELERPKLGTLTLEAMPRHERREPVFRDPDALGFIQFSSGTTAQPKPIALTHRQILANVTAITTAILDAHPESETLRHSGCSWLPLYHDMGLVGCVFVAMGYHRDLTLIPPEHFLARPALWLRALARHGATISPAPNFAYSLCVERIDDEELDGVDLSRWLIALNGAEPVTPRVLERFVERFSCYGFPENSLTPVYGLGEATLAVTFSALGQRWRWRRFDRGRLAEALEAVEVEEDGVELVSLGLPLPGFGVQIRGDDCALLPDRRVGQVWIRGPSLMSGYHRMDSLNNDVFDDEWLKTGDRGFLDQGELYLFGREKDTVVLHGRNYAAQDIEAALDGLAGVRRGCVAAVGRVREEGEVLQLLVETKLDAPAERADLEERVRAAVFTRCALSAEVTLLARGTLPRTSSGKIARARAREALEAGTLEAPKPVTALRMANELARSYLARRRGARK